MEKPSKHRSRNWCIPGNGSDTMHISEITSYSTDGSGDLTGYRPRIPHSSSLATPNRRR